MNAKSKNERIKILNQGAISLATIAAGLVVSHYALMPQNMQANTVYEGPLTYTPKSEISEHVKYLTGRGSGKWTPLGGMEVTTNVSIIKGVLTIDEKFNGNEDKLRIDFNNRKISDEKGGCVSSDKAEKILEKAYEAVQSFDPVYHPEIMFKKN